MQRVAISGCSGMVGSALADHLTGMGHDVVRLVRREPRRADEVHFDIDAGHLDVEALASVDAVVHLAGENVGDGRWSAAKKQRIVSSRVRGTRLLASELATRKTGVRSFVCASAIGLYGDRGDELLDETSDAGSDFLADVCAQWEAACEPARRAGIRTVNARIGVVLSLHGGALAKMITPFKLGLGGVIGSGSQWLSWISLADVVDGLAHLALQSQLDGPVNLVAPTPVTNRELTVALGRHLRRPTAIAMPAFAARLAFGERADALLLASARVSADKLEADGYAFRHQVLDDALRDMLSTERGEAA